MLLIKPKDTNFYKLRLKSNLSFLLLSLVDQFMRLMEGSITGVKDCSLSKFQLVLPFLLKKCFKSFF